MEGVLRFLLGLRRATICRFRPAFQFFSALHNIKVRGAEKKIEKRAEIEKSAALHGRQWPRRISAGLLD
jgi:hypothetical protein